MRRAFTVVALAALIAPAIPAHGARAGEGAPGEASPLEARPVEARQVEVVRGSVPRMVSAVGTFKARRTVVLGSQVSGRVDEVLVDVADVVKKGDPLVKLDGALFAITRDRRSADLEAAQVSRADALVNFSRMKNLWEKPTGGEPSIPKKLYDDAKARLDTTETAVRQAEQALRYAARELDETVIRAPWDGVVSKRFVDPGEPVTSQPVVHLIEIVETASLDLDFSLPQEMQGRVGRGARVELEVEGVTAADAPALVTSVALVFPTLDEATRSIRCRAIVANPEGSLRPGALVRVRVQDGVVEDVLTVDERALVASPGGFRALVWKDGKAEPRVVEVGARGGGRAEVRSGLAAGERVLRPSSGGGRP